MNPNPTQPERVLIDPPDPGAGALGDERILVVAAMIADAHRAHTPGAMVLASDQGRWRVESIGAPGASEVPARTRRIDLSDRVVVPALVNAHTHLDLTHIGPIAHDPQRGFVSWVDTIRAQRRTDPDEIRASVRE